MPFVGQDRFNNAARAAIEKRAGQMGAVRRGEWGRVPQESTAAYKRMLANKKNMDRWSEAQQRINQQ
jgi:hypothetical protein